MKKLLIVSSNSIHLFNFYNLINSYFDYIDIAIDSINDKFEYKNANLYKFNFSIKEPLNFLFLFSTKKIIKNKLIFSNTYTSSINSGTDDYIGC